MVEVNDTINQLDIININMQFYLTTVQYILLKFICKFTVTDTLLAIERTLKNWKD